MKGGKLPWGRLLAESVLIVVSVYLAIVLEGMSADRQAGREARTALAQMMSEMQQDRADLVEIRAEQLALDRHYTALDRWLARPEAMPLDSASLAMDEVFWSNRTLYPRRSAWTTMVAAGQLGDLDSPDLVTRLGNFYESVNVRVIDNGSLYDESVNAIARSGAVEVWDGSSGRLVTSSPGQVRVFRNQLRWMHNSLNLFYLELLEDYAQRLDELIAEIEAHLAGEIRSA